MIESRIGTLMKSLTQQRLVTWTAQALQRSLMYEILVSFSCVCKYVYIYIATAFISVQLSSGEWDESRNSVRVIVKFIYLFICLFMHLFVNWYTLKTFDMSKIMRIQEYK